MADFNHQLNSNIAKDIRPTNTSSVQRQAPNSFNGPYGDSMMQNSHISNTNSFSSSVTKSGILPSELMYNPAVHNSADSSLPPNPQQLMNANRPPISLPSHAKPVVPSIPTFSNAHMQPEALTRSAISQNQHQNIYSLPHPGDNLGYQPPTGLPPGPLPNGPPRPSTSVASQLRMPGIPPGVAYGRPPAYGLHSVSSPSVVQPVGDMIGSSPTPSDSKTNSSLGQSYPPNLLPLPSGRGPLGIAHSQNSGSPGTSEPTSSKSSRNPSPIPTQRYDAMEGQFSSRPSPATSCANLHVLNHSQSSGITSAQYSSNSNVYQQSSSGRQSGPRPPLLNNQAVSLSEMMPPPTSSNFSPGMMTHSSSQPMPNTVVQDASLPPPSTTVLGTTNASLIGNVVPGMTVHPPLNNTIPGTVMNTSVSSYSNSIPTSTFNYNPASTVSTSMTNVASQQYSGMQHSGYPVPSQGPPSINRPSIVNSRRQYPQQMYQQLPSQPQIPPQGNIHLENSNVTTGTMTHTNYSQQHTSYSNSNINQSSQNYGPNQLAQQVNYLSFQGSETIDLMQHRNILPLTPLEAPKIVIPHQDYNTINCIPDIFRCTLTKIPGTQSLLQKSRLPLGILIHPFKDLSHLPVIQCTTIVRCRSCRTYINPFVSFVDSRRWKCNLCFRVNELPEEFLYDPVSKNYGDPARRPEVKSATIEFIAPSEYMLRPPQPAVYLFLMDVSHAAMETGYLQSFCNTLLEELDKLPGDGRTQVGFITFDSSIHFYNLAEGLSQPQMIVVSDVDDIFLPSPDNLLVNLHESKELVQDLLHQLPMKFLDNQDTDCALGAALQASYKLVAPTGGRITVIQGTLPNCGPGALKSREDPNQRAGKDVHNVGPANDFYKKLSLDCSGQQIAVDLFIVASQYVDIATIACISKYSGGSIHYYPGFHHQLNVSEVERFEEDMRRYLTRKIGFEAVMRIRCTKGLAIHTFHGNFFVRSTDLLSLPNINPDAGFGMQVSIEEQLTEINTACFQAALLYTSSKGERRIRVHTLCLGVTGILNEVLMGADQQAIVSLLTKMAVDRTLISSLSDARDALINACIDPLWVYKTAVSNGSDGLVAPISLRLLPLYILAILKHKAFRVATSTKLDERVFAMNQMKTLPLSLLILSVYPNLYAVHALDEKNAIIQNDKLVPQLSLLQLSSEKIDSHGAYIMDTGDRIYLYVCRAINDQFCRNVLKATNFAAIDDKINELPELETSESELLRNFITHLQGQRSFHASFHILREDSKSRYLFLQHLIEDRSESAFSYYELLQHLKQRVREYK